MSTKTAFALSAALLMILVVLAACVAPLQPLPAAPTSAASTETPAIRLDDETLGRASSICEGALLPAAAQQQFLADYTRRFFDAALGRGDSDTAALGIDPAQPAPATLFGRPVLTSLALPTPQRLRLTLSEDGAGGAATADLCEQGYLQAEEKMEPCRRMQFNQPG